jgi:hypothetical protein
MTTHLSPIRVAHRPSRIQERNEHSPAVVKEEHRWLLLLVPLALSAMLFGAAIGSGTNWLLAPAAALGPWALITGLVHLALTSDTNTPDTASFLGPRQATSRKRGR